MTGMGWLRGALSGLVICALAPALLAAPAIHPFNSSDLVLLERVSDPRISPDGRWVAYQLLETDLAANRSITSLWLAPIPDAKGSSSDPRFARRLTAPGVSGFSPRWRGDGRFLFFLSTRSGNAQVWRMDLSGGEAQAVTHGPLEIGSFLVAPDGRHLAASMSVFPECENLDC